VTQEMSRPCGDAADLVAWDQLTGEEQTRLRVEYGHYLDQLPPTCSLEEKSVRFANWLARRRIRYGAPAAERE
jgi:hypothetical protein